MNSRRTFLKRGALFVPFIFAPKLIRAQGILAKKQSVGSLNQRVVSGGGGGSLNMITGGENSGSITAWGATYLGCKLTVGASPIDVTQIGVYLSVADGYTNALVQIRAADGTTVLKSATINLAGGNNTVGRHLSAAFAPVTLSASTSYFLCCDGAFQSMRTSGTVVTTRSEVTVNDSAYESGGVMTVESAGAGHTYGPIDLVYTV